MARHHVTAKTGSAAIGDQATAVVRDAVEIAGHGVLAHTEVQIAFGFHALWKLASPLVSVRVGVGEVGGAAVSSAGWGDRSQAVVGVTGGGQAFQLG